MISARNKYFSQKGEILTVVALAALAVIGVSTLAARYISKNPQILKSKAYFTTPVCPATASCTTEGAFCVKCTGRTAAAGCETNTGEALVYQCYNGQWTYNPPHGGYPQCDGSCGNAAPPPQPPAPTTPPSGGGGTCNVKIICDIRKPGQEQGCGGICDPVLNPGCSRYGMCDTSVNSGCGYGGCRPNEYCVKGQCLWEQSPGYDANRKCGDKSNAPIPSCSPAAPLPTSPPSAPQPTAPPPPPPSTGGNPYCNMTGKLLGNLPEGYCSPKTLADPLMYFVCNGDWKADTDVAVCLRKEANQPAAINAIQCIGNYFPSNGVKCCSTGKIEDGTCMAAGASTGGPPSAAASPTSRPTMTPTSPAVRATVTIAPTVNPAPTSTPTTTPTATSTPQPLAPTRIPTATLRPSPTSTPVPPTITRIPTNTPVSIPSSTPIPTNTPTLSPTEKPQPTIDQSLEKMVIWSSDPNRPQVALTLDDAWYPDMVQQTIEIAKSENIRLTAFLPGKSIAAAPQIVPELVNAGWEIENHGYNHDLLNDPNLSDEKISHEIMDTQTTLNNTLSNNNLPLLNMVYFRPPGGALPSVKTEKAERNRVLNLIKNAGIEKIIIWTTSTGSSSNGATKETSLTNLFGEDYRNNPKRISNGSIILMHFVRADIEALPEILGILRNQGLQIITLSELLNGSVPVVIPTIAPTVTPTPVEVHTGNSVSILEKARILYYDAKFRDNKTITYYIDNNFINLNLEICSSGPCTNDNCDDIPGVKCYWAGSDAVYNIDGNLCGQGGRGAVCTDYVLMSYKDAGFDIKEPINTRYAPYLMNIFKNNPKYDYYSNGNTQTPQVGDVIFFSNDGNSASHVAVVSDVKPSALKIIQYNARKCYWIGFIKSGNNITVDDLTVNYGTNTQTKQVLGWGRLKI